MAAVARIITAMLVLIILLGGYGFFTDKYRTEELLERVRYNNMLLESNTVALSNLLTKSSARPLKFDACDGSVVVGAMRQGGIKVDAQDFEARCKAAKKLQ